VVGVADGDTITVLDGRTEVKVRLYGIDCPTGHQAFGNRAKQFTSDFVFGQVVDVDPVTKDRYGRTVGVVRVRGKTLNEELVRVGMAWVCIECCKQPTCREWSRLQEEARKAKRGLWADRNPVPPWEFRKEKRRSR
jgi:endonuclease YncB( thermonuclease family)